MTQLEDKSDETDVPGYINDETDGQEFDASLRGVSIRYEYYFLVKHALDSEHVASCERRKLNFYISPHLSLLYIYRASHIYIAKIFASHLISKKKNQCSNTTVVCCRTTEI